MTGVDGNQASVEFVEWFQSCFFPSVLECWPVEVRQDGINAGSLSIAAGNPVRRSALHLF